MIEEHILTGSDEPVDRMVELMHGNVYNYHEVALDYIHAGLRDEALFVLQTSIDSGAGESPLTYYYMAYASEMGFEYLKKAVKTSPDYCFPNRLEDAFILKCLGLMPFVKMPALLTTWDACTMPPASMTSPSKTGSVRQRLIQSSPPYGVTLHSDVSINKASNKRR